MGRLPNPGFRIQWTLDEVMFRVNVDADGCWLWKVRPLRCGYGVVAERHGPGPKKYVTAHRFIYELLMGPIPVGLDLDHVCHSTDPDCVGGHSCKHRACVNPNHLEPVTPEENMRRAGARKTHCKRGHLLDGWNLILYKGRRICRTCKYARNKAYMERKAQR